jgi:hypothetical protein
MTKKQLSKVLSKAADVIQRDGLCKGDFGSNDGRKCALGAIRYVRNKSTNVPSGISDDVINGLFMAARPRTRLGYLSLFNDLDRTRKHDVVEVLRDMAVQAAL